MTHVRVTEREETTPLPGKSGGEGKWTGGREEVLRIQHASRRGNDGGRSVLRENTHTEFLMLD